MINASLILPYLFLLFIAVAFIEPRGATNIMLRLYIWSRKKIMELDKDKAEMVKNIKRERARTEKVTAKAINFGNKNKFEKMVMIILALPAMVTIKIVNFIEERVFNFIGKKKIQEIDHFTGLD